MTSFGDATESFEIFSLGTTVSHYVIEKVLGAGGMGVVYLARDTVLDRRVALKFLPRGLSQDASTRERFKQEALIIAQLNHPNIVTIHEVGEFEQRPFIAMEFVDGGSLAAYCMERQLSLEKVLELAIQISEGLIEAHKQGVIHSDIKPSNILITSRGGAKILDFGLAFFKGKDYCSRRSVEGTIQYMSPEQVQGRDIDARSDLFSFGVVLYEVLAGQHPFSGRDMADTVQALVKCEPAPMSTVSVGVPVEVQRIIQTLVAKNPEHRYQRGEDVRSDLRYALEAVLSGRVQCAPDTTKEYSRSIAVLAFSNISPDAEQSYFCEGVAEDIINALTKVQGLRVAARVSSFAFKDSHESAREIGRKLHVDVLLEGSVRRSSDRLRIAVQLIDVATGYQLWSEQYDETMTDVFTIQDRITRAVVSRLRLLLTPEVSAPRTAVTSDPRAYDFYLKGRQFYNQGRRNSLRFALQMFTKATEIDPSYALAFAGIADCCALLVHFYGESEEVHLTQADYASQRSLELNPELPQAHAARGFTLWLMNRFEEAWAAFETSISKDPHQTETLYLYGRACFQRGDFSKAAGLFEQACKIREHHEARYFEAQTFVALGDQDSALTSYRLAFRAIEKHVEMNPDDARALTMGAVSLCRVGERVMGLEWVERALQADPTDPGIQYNAACLFALEDQPARAIACLEAAAAGGFAHRDWVEKDPDLDSLRADPRFQAIKWRDTSIIGQQ